MLYPKAATKCYIPLLPPNVVYRCAATKCCNLVKKMIFEGGVGDKKLFLVVLYTPGATKVLLIPKWLSYTMDV